MTRLNSYIRAEIVKNALAKAGHATGREAYRQRREDWIEAVRLHGLQIDCLALSVIEAKIEKLRLQIPEHIRGEGTILLERNRFRINAGGERELLYFPEVDGKDTRVTASEVTLPFGHALLVEREALKAEDARLDELKARIEGPVKAAVGAVTTVKALLNAWPEAKELLPGNLDEAKPRLPALRPEALNALIGLPSELDALPPVE